MSDTMDTPEVDKIRFHFRAAENHLRRLRERTGVNVKLFVEGEGHLYLVDQDQDTGGAIEERQKAVVANLGASVLWTCGTW